MEDRIRVLLVDDDRLHNKTLRLVLSNGLFHIRTTTRSRGAVSLAREFRPHVALIDMVMDVPGETVAGRLREIMPNLGLIGVTAKLRNTKQIREFRDDTDMFFEKPYDVRNLAGAIYELFTAKQRQSLMERCEHTLDHLSARHKGHEMLPDAIVRPNSWAPGFSAVPTEEEPDVILQQRFPGDVRLVDTEQVTMRFKVSDDLVVRRFAVAALDLSEPLSAGDPVEVLSVLRRRTRNRDLSARELEALERQRQDRRRVFGWSDEASDEEGS
ncbi:two-component system response regulator [Candidatus Latescibacterota bacterium]